MIKLIIGSSIFLGFYIAFGKTTKENVRTAKMVKNLGNFQGIRGLKLTKKHRLSIDITKQGVFIVAPPRKGKTASLYLTNMLTENLMKCSKILTDIKGELWEITHDYRESLGEKCVLLELLGDTVKGYYNPLDFAKDYDEVKDIARSMLYSTMDKGYEEWAEMSIPLVSATLLYVKTLAKPYQNISHAVSLLCTKTPIQLAALFAKTKDRRIVELGNMFLATSQSEGTSGSIYSTIFGKLNIYNSPSIAKTMSRSSFTPDELRQELVNVYIKYDLEQGEYLTPVLSIIFSQLLGKVVSNHNRFENELPILFLCDEMQNIGKIPKLEQLANTCTSANVGLICCCQSISALYEKYGEYNTKTILNALQTKIVLPGISDPETLEFIYNLMGTIKLSNTKDDKDKKPIFEKDEIRRIAEYHALVICENLNLLLDELDLWFRNKECLTNKYGKDWWKDWKKLRLYLFGIKKSKKRDEEDDWKPRPSAQLP